ncbi:2-dehydropantoate 2-reductase [Lacimicrobium sp. SS2-24]|uniref:2-dehydropantoate 2-reductase n=1 Tax=Lacimicrobium sp. SS2-24 TaxID=2005569 RepID=UPI000B4BD043|nr:2-dehydropantoate 2-reductase [Lacimicrobium sp. SS2-24]
MQHIIFGAGLIGRYVGAVMASQGLNVCLVGRAKASVKTEQEIRLSHYQGGTLGPVTLKWFDSQNAQAIPPTDVLWLTVKCTSIEQAIRDMAPLIRPATCILCCQNGLGADALVREAFPNNRVLRGVVGFNVTQTSQGTLHCGSQGSLVLEKDARCASMAQWGAQLNCKLLSVEFSDAMTELQWSKLQLNLGNAVNALADIPVQSMLRQRCYRKVLATLMEELLAVVKAKGLHLPRLTALPGHWVPRVLKLPDWLFVRIANKMLEIDPQVRTSMWWDLHQNRKTEVAFLNGAVVEEALSLGLVCTANQVIHQLIKEVEQGIRQPGITGDELLRLVCNGPQ